jgi:hypothetical protein
VCPVQYSHLKGNFFFSNLHVNLFLSVVLFFVPYIVLLVLISISILISRHLLESF